MPTLPAVRSAVRAPVSAPRDRWHRLPLRVRIAYALGGMTDSVKAVASALYMLFFYSTVMGLPAKLVGLAAGVSLAWDAFIDPFIGRLSDRTTGRFGRRHGWMLAGTIGTGLGFFILFSPLHGLPTWALFAWLLLAWLLLRGCHSMFSVPYMALGAELCVEYDERTSMAGYRAVASQVGALIASALTLLIFFPSSAAGDARLNPESYANMAIALGTVIAAAGAVATFGTWGCRRYTTILPGAKLGAPLARPARTLKILFGSAPFLRLTGAASLHFVGGVIASTLTVYFMTYYARVSTQTMALCQFALYAGLIAGVPVWTRIAGRYEKHQAQAAASVLTGALVLSGFWVGHADGYFQQALVPLLAAAYALIGLAWSGVVVLPTSMLADVIDDDELRSSERREGILVGGFSAALQLSAGVATVIAGVLVDAFVQIVPGVTAQSATVTDRIGLLACAVPGVLMMLAGALILPYALTRERAHEIQAALAR